MVDKDLTLNNFTSGTKIESAKVNSNFTNTRSKVYEIIDALGSSGSGVAQYNYSKGMILEVNDSDASQVDITPTTSDIAILMKYNGSDLVKFSENATKSLDVSTVNTDTNGFYSIYAVSDGGDGPIDDTNGITLEGVFDNATPFSGSAPADSILVGAVYLYDSEIIGMWNAEEPNQSVVYTASWINDTFAKSITGTSVSYDVNKQLLIPLFFDSFIKFELIVKVRVTDTFTLLQPTIQTKLNATINLTVREYFYPEVSSTTEDLETYLYSNRTKGDMTAGLNYIYVGGFKETGSADYVIDDVYMTAETFTKNVRAFEAKESDI